MERGLGATRAAAYTPYALYLILRRPTLGRRLLFIHSSLFVLVGKWSTVTNNRAQSHTTLRLAPFLKVIH